MELTGKIIEVLQPQSGVSNATGKEWIKRAYVLETNDQYPHKVHFTTFNLDTTAEMGDSVAISLDIESREYEGRWYTDVRAWKITKL